MPPSKRAKKIAVVLPPPPLDAAHFGGFGGAAVEGVADVVAANVDSAEACILPLPGGLQETSRSSKDNSPVECGLVLVPAVVKVAIKPKGPKGIANWNPVERWVSAQHVSNPCILHFCIHADRTVDCSQAACRAFYGANERHSASTELYRITVAANAYPRELVHIVGSTGAGNGIYGHHPFPVKKRPPSQGRLMWRSSLLTLR